MGVKGISITAVFFRLFIISQLAFTLISCQSETKEVPEIEKGLINLSNWDFEQKGTIQLDSEWNIGINRTGYEDMSRFTWHLTGHFFFSPFYMLDYAIAGLGAMQVYNNYLNNRQKGINNYYNGLRN